MLAFLRSVKVELDQVKWPTAKETRSLTLVVVLASLLVGLYIGGLDLLLTSLLTTIIK